MGSGERVAINSEEDIVTARQHGRAMAARLGFSGSEATLIAAAIAEIARNIVEHAQRGEVLLECLESGQRRGLQIVAQDNGPGIADVPQALQYGYSSRQGQGVGLPGAKWLMDEFDLQSTPGTGTTVTMKKWLPAADRESKGRGDNART